MERTPTRDLGRAVVLAPSSRLAREDVERAALRFAEQHEISTCGVRVSEPVTLGASDVPVRIVELLAGAEAALDRFCPYLRASERGLACLRFHAASGVGGALLFEERKLVDRRVVLDESPDALSAAIASVVGRLLGDAAATPLSELVSALARADATASVTLARNNGAPAANGAHVVLEGDWLSRRVDDALETGIVAEVLRPVAVEIARLADDLVRARRARGSTTAAIDRAEAALWARALGHRRMLRRDELAAVLALGGLSEDAARRRSRAVLDEEYDEDAESVDAAPICAHCGSGVWSGRCCTVCGQEIGTKPAPDRAFATADRLVRGLVTSSGLALVTPNAVHAVIAQTASMLRDLEDEDPAAVAAALEEAWMDRADVSELFVDVDAILAALRSAST